jgi:hypothetical protein
MVMTKPQQKEQPLDDFGATLLTSLGDPHVDNVCYEIVHERARY